MGREDPKGRGGGYGRLDAGGTAGVDRRRGRLDETNAANGFGGAHPVVFAVVLGSGGGANGSGGAGAAAAPSERSRSSHMSRS